MNTTVDSSIHEFKAAQERLRPRTGHVHLVGVCGVGMAGLALHLRQRGLTVTGCDAARNPLAAWLEQRGVSVAGAHDPAHLAGVDWLVRTAAVGAEHPEIQAANARGIPVFRRGVVLAALLAEYKSVCVCGSHGKTTTAAMITQVFRHGGLAPAYCIGGESAALDGVAGAGAGGIMVAEADESDGTLELYAPEVAVVTNLEFDHAEHFDGMDELRACFAAMLRRVRRRIIYCADDPEASRLCAGLAQTVSYGFSGTADFRAEMTTESARDTTFRLVRAGRDAGEIRLPVSGRQNALNALAAVAAADAFGLDVPGVRAALEKFAPARRRFERIAERDGVQVISDYAHHPTEVAALVRQARRLEPKRLLAVFQPHRYSRTRALGADFPRAFEGVDELIIAPVYAASEKMLAGGTAWDLYARFRAAGLTKTYCAASLAQIWGYWREHIRDGDVLLIVGAGDVDQIARWAKAELELRGARELGPARVWRNDLARLSLADSVVREKEPLACRTTLQVGGEADIFVEVGSQGDLARILKWTHDRQVPIRILGAGSNALVSDLGVRGVVLRLSGAEFRRLHADGALQVTAGAGATLSALTGWLAERGRAGLEFLHGIPGTVGGAVRMNASAEGAEIGARVIRVRCLRRDGTEEVLEGRNLRFEYRRCAGLDERVILEATLAVDPGEPEQIRKRMAETLRRRAWLSGRRSAGSVFKNPPGDFAGRLIEQAGFMGRGVGGARVTGEHANVIVTEAGALASDVLALMGIIRAEVKNKFDVELNEEIVCLE